MTLFAHDLGSSPVRDSEPAGGRRASARGEVARTPVDRVVADGPIERLLPSISARILKASHEELDAVVRDCLRQVLETLQLDRGALVKVQQECSRVMVSHAWYSPGAELLLERVNLAEQTPWTYEQLVLQGRTLIKTGVDSMPPEATLDRAAFVRLGIKTALAIPLSLDGRVHHILVVHATRKPVLLPLPLVPQLHLLGEIFISAIERRDMLKAHAIHQERLDMAAASAMQRSASGAASSESCVPAEAAGATRTNVRAKPFTASRSSAQRAKKSPWRRNPVMGSRRSRPGWAGMEPDSSSGSRIRRSPGSMGQAGSPKWVTSACEVFSPTSSSTNSPLYTGVRAVGGRFSAPRTG